MPIDEFDITDSGFTSESELSATGSIGFTTESIVDVASGTISVTSGATLTGYDDPIQIGDIVVISGNAAAGTYTVDTIPTLETFTVVEAIVDAVGGSAEFRHPAGGTRVGLDISGLTRITTANVQGALSDIDGAQPNVHAASHAENAADEINAEDLGAVDAGFPNRVMVTTGTGGWVISDEEFLEGLPTEFQHDQSVAQSATTSATYVSKLLLTTAALDGGDYVVFYNAFVGGSQNGTVSAAQIAFDGGTPFGETVLKSSSNNSVNSYAGHEVFLAVTPGVHTVEMFWRLFSGGGSALIQNAQISLWRVN